MSNDLISRKALNDALIERFQNADDMYIAGKIVGLVGLQRTAYDIDKVVDRLELKATYWYNNISKDGAGAVIAYHAFKEAIEIVKGGRSNEAD